MGRRARNRSEAGGRGLRIGGGETPGAVLKGPPITLTCECGQKRDLPYGERWRCEQCGRTSDTNRIPGAPALLAPPTLAVGEVALLPALAGERDRRPLEHGA